MIIKEEKTMQRQDDLEKKALKLIINYGKKGILQSELWRKMDGSSREGSRISIKLEKKGLIQRMRELSNGRWTYRLYSTKQPVSISSILNCPCLTCTKRIRCGVGVKNTPIKCNLLTNWIIESINKHNEYVGGD
jgi:hypothetical protein